MQRCIQSTASRPGLPPFEATSTSLGGQPGSVLSAIYFKLKYQNIVMNINIDSGPGRDGGGGNDSPGGSSDDQRPWQSGPLVTNRPTNRWPLGTCETAIASSNLRSIILLCCQEAIGLGQYQTAPRITACLTLNRRWDKYAHIIQFLPHSLLEGGEKTHTHTSPGRV